jgi:hypothetical protein
MRVALVLNQLIFVDIRHIGSASMIWSTFVLDAARAIALVAAVNAPIAILILVLAGRKKVEQPLVARDGAITFDDLVGRLDALQ